MVSPAGFHNIPPIKTYATPQGRNSCATRTAGSALEFCGALVGVGPHSIRVQTVTHQEYPKTIQNADCHDPLPIGKTKQQRSPLAKGLVTESLSLRAVLPLCVAENHTHLPGKTARQSAFTSFRAFVLRYWVGRRSSIQSGFYCHLSRNVLLPNETRLPQPCANRHPGNKRVLDSKGFLCPRR